MTLKEVQHLREFLESNGNTVSSFMALCEVVQQFRASQGNYIVICKYNDFKFVVEQQPDKNGNLEIVSFEAIPELKSP